MLKTISSLIGCIIILASASAQKISEQEAQQLMEKAWGYIKISDSISFVNLWTPEDSAGEKLHIPAESTELNRSFNRLKDFLEPARSKNLAIDHIIIAEENTRGTEITAMFKPREHAYIGFSMYVVRINDKLIPRDKPRYLAKSQ